MPNSYYDEIDKNMKDKVDMALADIDLQERIAMERLAIKRDAAKRASLNEMNSAYVGYVNAVNPYGVNNEALYASGLGASGKSETARAAYYAAYTGLLGKLKEAAAAQMSDFDMQESDIGADAMSKRTDVQAGAYNDMLAELRRRADDEWERQKYADSLKEKEREYLLKEAQAEYNRQKDERDYAFKADNEAFDREIALRSLALKGTSSSKAAQSEASPIVSPDMEELIRDDPYVTLRYIFRSLDSSVLPGEDNPAARIKNTKRMYLDAYKSLLTSKEYQKLKEM